MILNDTELKLLQQLGYIPTDAHVGPCSVDLRLGDSFILDAVIIDNNTFLSDHHFKYEDDKIVSIDIMPNAFILATTKETIKIPTNMCAQVSGRSSIGRLGLQVQNAGFIDAGFEGEITLELKNQSSNIVTLDVGQRICQVIFIQLTGHVNQPYKGKYQGQTGATGSKLHLDSENYCAYEGKCQE